MNGVTISWDENSPANTDQIGSGDDVIRSIRTALRSALDDEHYFPSTGGANTGYHRLGSARVYVGTESAVSSAGTEGRLMVSSDRSRLFHVGSGGTMHLGGIGALMGMIPTSGGYALPQTHYWAVNIGGGTSTSTGMINHTFTSAYSGQPNVFIQSNATTTGTGTVYQVWSVSAASFQAQSLLTDWATATGARAYQFISIGSRLLG